MVLHRLAKSLSSVTFHAPHAGWSDGALGSLGPITGAQGHRLSDAYLRRATRRDVRRATLLDAIIWVS